MEDSLNDDYAPVAITLAAIVYELNQSKLAQELLKKTVLSSKMHLVFKTIKYMLYSEHKAPFIEAINKVFEIEEDYNVSAASKDFPGSVILLPNNFENS